MEGSSCSLGNKQVTHEDSSNSDSTQEDLRHLANEPATRCAHSRPTGTPVVCHFASPEDVNEHEDQRDDEEEPYD